MPSCQITELFNRCIFKCFRSFKLSCSFLEVYCLGYSPIGTLQNLWNFDLLVSQRGVIDPNACVIRHWTHQLPHNQHQFHSPKYNRHTYTHIIITTIPRSYYCVCFEHLNISRRNESQSITESLWGLLKCTVCSADLMVVDQSQSCWISHASNCKEKSFCKSTTTTRNCGRKNETNIKITNPEKPWTTFPMILEEHDSRILWANGEKGRPWKPSSVLKPSQKVIFMEKQTYKSKAQRISVI